MQRPRFKRHWDDRKWQNPINSMTESATSNMLSSAFFLSSLGIPFLLGSYSVSSLPSMGASAFLLLSLFLLLVSVIMSLFLSLNSLFILSYSTPFLYVPILLMDLYLFFRILSAPFVFRFYLFFPHLTLLMPCFCLCFMSFSSSLILILSLFPCRLTDCSCTLNLMAINNHIEVIVWLNAFTWFRVINLIMISLIIDQSLSPTPLLVTFALSV